MLKLFHYWDSFCSIKTRLALEEKGLAYEGVFVDLLAFEQLQPDYTRKNSKGVVPTLEHDDQVIVESTVINEYLEDVFPDPRLLPRDPAARARARVLVKLEDDKAHEAVRAPTFNLMLKPMLSELPEAELDRIAASHPQPWIGDYWKKTVRTPVDQEAVDRALDVVREVCAELDAALLDGGPWLAGDDFSLADCAFAPLVDRIEHLGFAEIFDGYAALGGWIQRLKDRPAYGRSVPPDGKRLFDPRGRAAG